MAQLAGSDLFVLPAELPATVVDLGRLKTLPLVLGLFFAVLGCAAVGHALVSGVRRRRHDFAVLRTMGFTARQSRLSIAWQATLLGAVGVVVGVPLGVVVGRNVWRWLADEFPVLYVPPLTIDGHRVGRAARVVGREPHRGGPGAPRHARCVRPRRCAPIEADGRGGRSNQGRD